MVLRILVRVSAEQTEMWITGNLLTCCTENDWGPASINITQVGNFTEAPYKYKLTPLPLVPLVVKLGAGLGRI
jgi:hypothetical protein